MSEPHVLLPNTWRESVLFGAVGAALAVIFAGGLLVRWALPMGTPPLVMVALVVAVGATFLGVRRLLSGRRLELVLDGDHWIVRARGRTRRRAPVEAVAVTRGYHARQARGRRGWVPALAVDFPEGPWLVLGPRDPTTVWWWEGDDPARVPATRLQQPTHWLPGPRWVELVAALGHGEALQSTEMVPPG